jgi:hypothetical protein
VLEVSTDIFYNHIQPEKEGIDMIHMPHVHSNLVIAAKWGVINSQFYRFLMIFSSQGFFVSQMVISTSCYPFKVFLKRIRGLLSKREFSF